MKRIIRHNEKNIAPNGKPSNLTAEQYKLVRSKAFKDWFGDWENDPENASKVVDENGEPLVCYHATPFEFTIFKVEKPTIGAYGQGFYFSNNKSFASNYAKGQNSKILNCFLKVKNIFEIDNDEFPIGYEKYSDMVMNKGTSRDFTIKLKSLSYDGVLAKNTYEENEFVVFEPNQIKLADGTNTTFDGSNPDIRYADGGEVTNKNFFQNTNADFRGVSKKDALEIMQEYVKWRRKRNKPEFIQVSKFGNLKVDFESEKKNSFWRSRSFSFYFVSEDNKFVIRISDHWSASSYPKSKKLNCGSIRTCYWTNYAEEKFDFTIPSESYSSDLLGGLCYFKDFEVTSDSDIQFSQGGTMKKVKRGGITYGKSHAEGGIPVKNASTGQMLEVEGGEGIVNKRSMASGKKVNLNGRDMTICDAVSELNQKEGGVAFSCDDVESKQFIDKMAKGGELESFADDDKNEYFTLVIKNIKDPNEIGQGGVKNMYRGSYAKIFDILNEESVFGEVGSIDEELIENDLYVTLDRKPTPSELDRILKMKNVSIASEMGDGGMANQNSYNQRIELNLEQMGTPKKDWSAVPISGFANVEVNGKLKTMPEFTFPKNYTKPPTLFPNNQSGDMNCELCGRSPIKNAYYIQNDIKKYILLVGSECVTHFGDGASGKDNLRQFKINQAEILNNDLKKALDYLKETYSKIKIERNWKGGTTKSRQWVQSYVTADYDNFYNQNVSDFVKQGKLDSLFTKKTSGKEYILWYELADKIKPFDTAFYEKYQSENKEAQLLAWFKRNKESAEEFLKALSLFERISKNVILDFDSIQDTNLEVSQSKKADGGKLKKGGKMYSSADREKIHKVMREFKKGKLHSGSKHGKIVTDPNQAIAIAISEAKRNKMADGGEVKSLEKYQDFFDRISRLNQDFRNKSALYFQTLDEGIATKQNNTLPKKEKEAKLEDLRIKARDEKKTMEDARAMLQGLSQNESPFYAPKLAEGGQLSDYSSYLNVKDGDSGVVYVKPIKHDVSTYNLPKSGFTINWEKKNGINLVELTCRIGKRALPSVDVLKPMFFNFYKDIVKYYHKVFPKIDVEKSYVQWTFNNFENDPLTLITDFINALRYANNPIAFNENYNPDTRSVYSGGGGQQQQESQIDLDILAKVFADDIGTQLNEMGYTEPTKEWVKHLLERYPNFAKALLGAYSWLSLNPTYNNWSLSLRHLCQEAYSRYELSKSSQALQNLSTPNSQQIKVYASHLEIQKSHHLEKLIRERDANLNMKNALNEVIPDHLLKGTIYEFWTFLILLLLAVRSKEFQ